MKNRGSNPLESTLGGVLLVAALVATGLLLNAFAPGVWNWIAQNSPNGDALFLIALAALTILVVIFTLITKGGARLLSLL